MKKIVILAMVLVALVVTLTACGNRQIFDTTYHFGKAIVALPNGEVVEGKLDTWNDYDGSDTVQVKIDGVTYLTHYDNVCLIAE